MTIKDRALSIVRGDCPEQEPRGSKRPKNRKEKSARPMGKRVEPGNPSDRDMLIERSSESPLLKHGERQKADWCSAVTAK